MFGGEQTGLAGSGKVSALQPAVIGWLFSLLTGTVLLTSLYNESRGSLLVVALFHAGVDVAFTSAASSPVVTNTAGALITLWGIAVVMAVGPRRLASIRKHRS